MSVTAVGRIRTSAAATAAPSPADRIRDLAGFPCTKSDEQAIANIVCSHQGAALQTLIAELNQKSDPSFDDIVFNAIDDDGVRERIPSALR